MTDQVTVKFHVPANIERNLKVYISKKKKMSEEAVLKTAFRIEGDAKRRCAVDTGRLRSSISTAWTGGPPQQTKDKIKRPVSIPKRFIVAIGSNVFYSKYVEFGTSKMSARPFLFPAFFANIGSLMRKIKTECKD